MPFLSIYPSHSRIVFPLRARCFTNHSDQLSRQGDHTQSLTIVMSTVAAATASILDPADIAISSASKETSPTSSSPTLVCDGAHFISGRFMLDHPSNNVYGIGRFKAIFHQDCTCQWEEWQCHQDNPTGPPEKVHMTHHKKILQSSQDLSNSKIKQSTKG